MITINPCNCGGIPYMAPYYTPNDIYEEDQWWTVRCIRCGTCGSLELTEDEALSSWNEKNK